MLRNVKTSATSAASAPGVERKRRASITSRERGDTLPHGDAAQQVPVSLRSDRNPT